MIPRDLRNQLVHLSADDRLKPGDRAMIPCILGDISLEEAVAVKRGEADGDALAPGRVNDSTLC